MQHFDEQQQAYKQLESKYKELLDNEEHNKKEKLSSNLILQENEQLKQKNLLLESEILTTKSTQSHHQDLQINIERLQQELQLGVSFVFLSFSKHIKTCVVVLQIKERETTSMLNTQLRNDITNITNTNERVSE